MIYYSVTDSDALCSLTADLEEVSVVEEVSLLDAKKIYMMKVILYSSDGGW